MNALELVGSLDWVTTQPVSSARTSNDCPLTREEWNLRLDLGPETHILLIQPMGGLTKNGVPIRRCTMIRTSSTIRQLLVSIRSLTTSVGPNAMEDRVYFEGLHYSQKNGVNILEVLTGS